MGADACPHSTISKKKSGHLSLFMGPIGGEPRLIFGGVRDNQWSPLLSASTLFPLVTNRV